MAGRHVISARQYGKRGLSGKAAGSIRTEAIMRKLLATYEAAIAGTISCFDRVLFSGRRPSGRRP